MNLIKKLKANAQKPDADYYADLISKKLEEGTRKAGKTAVHHVYAYMYGDIFHKIL